MQPINSSLLVIFFLLVYFSYANPFFRSFILKLSAFSEFQLFFFSCLKYSKGILGKFWSINSLYLQTGLWTVEEEIGGKRNSCFGLICSVNIQGVYAGIEQFVKFALCFLLAREIAKSSGQFCESRATIISISQRGRLRHRGSRKLLSPGERGRGRR